MIDEAAQAMEPLSLIALNYIDSNAQGGLVGDYMQLPPVVHNRAAAFAGLDLNLFERLFNLPGQAAITLTEQHRMHHSISAWPSQHFYRGLLINAAAV